MVTTYLSGHGEIKSIGSEQGGIPKWDDVVVEFADGSFKHFQVKRQLSNFDDALPERDKYVKGDRTGHLKDLTPLDESMKSLAECAAGSGTQGREFIFKVPTLDLEIKRGLSLRTFKGFLDQINEHSTLEGLKVLIEKDSQGTNIVAWLRSWCGVQDDAHLLKVLKAVTIELTGDEQDLKERIREILAPYFTSLDSVLPLIQGCIRETSTFTSAVTPKAALLAVHAYLKPDIPSWCEYRVHEDDWRVSGIHDLGSGNELAPAVVSALWKPKRRSSLRMNAPLAANNTELAKSILRLALHFQRDTMAFVSQSDGWKMAAKSHIGHTLGTDVTDLDDLSISEFEPNFDSQEVRCLSSLADQDQEALMLTNEMYRVTWGLVCATVSAKVSSDLRDELRLAVDRRWREWKALIVDVEEYKRLCRSMLHASAEGTRVFPDLRVGPKTASLIAEGIFLLLIVSVSLYDRDDDWQTLGNALSVHTRALRCWSGPIGHTGSAMRLAGPGIIELIESESCKVLILPGIEAAGGELEEVLMTDSNTATPSLATAYRPSLIVTGSMSFRMAIGTGQLDTVKAFLTKQMRQI